MGETPEPIHRHVIFPFHYAPDSEMVFVVATIPERPGALAALLDVMSKRVDLVGSSSYTAAKDVAVFSGYGKLLSPSITAEELQDEITKSTRAESCHVWKSVEGLSVDRYHTGFQAGIGEPYVIFPARGLSDCFEGIVRVFGTGGGTLLYELGLDYAKARSPLYQKIMGSHPESRLDDLAAIVTALGYGKCSAAFDEGYKTLKLVAIECFECSSPTRVRRSCSFLRGLADGIYGPLFGVTAVSEETKCRNRGDDYCEFTLKAKDGSPFVRPSGS